MNKRFTQQEMIEKNTLHQTCLANIEERIQAIQEALDAAIAAGNEETKSSVGDKYETGRAMMQMEQDKHRSQLAKAQYLKAELLQTNMGKVYDKVEKGALVQTDSGLYFISTSVGKVTVGNKTCYAISIDAPLAKVLMGKTKNEMVIFQGKEHTVLEVW